MASFFHGIKLDSKSVGRQPFEEVDTAIIGIVGTAETGDLDKIYEINSMEDAIKTFGDIPKKDEDTHTLVKNLSAMFKQFDQKPTIYAVRSGEATEEEETRSVTGTEADKTGVYTFLKAKAQFGQSPNIILAPLFSGDRVTADALHSVAKKLKALAVIDRKKPDAPANGIEKQYTGKHSSRIKVVYPALNMVEEGKVGYSAVWAGIRARVDGELGYWVSCSNRQINGLESLTDDVEYIQGEENSEANKLNEARVTTVIREGSWRVWGNRTLGEGEDDNYSFVVARRTGDTIDRTVIANTFWAIDKGITNAFIKIVTDNVSDYLRDLKSNGAIYGGECWFDNNKNPTTDLKAGRIKFSYDFSPVSPAESITMESIITDRYIGEVFS